MKRVEKLNAPLLPTIQGVEDLRRIPKEEMPRLSQEIRDFLVEYTTHHGGHLASNLGVVELTLALHRVFDTPSDRIIWDVGHQSYVHKMVTGRMAGFETMRQSGGMSGFPRREESPFDPFIAGHSSTSISAALGFAQGDKMAGVTDRYTVVVIGDGAFTGGMAHEALNNCPKDLPLIVVLNENEMSIARVTGSFPRLVSRLRISRKYRTVKRGTQKFLRRIPLLGKPLYGAVRWVKNGVRSLFFRSNYFEDLGLHYMGPYNGNDYETVARALEQAKGTGRSVLLHLRTIKGKGYAPAEKNPNAYHCLYPNATGEQKFYEAFGEALLNLAEEDDTICAITPATPTSTGLASFGKIYPHRFFDVGIAEGHAMTFAAALAAAGRRPYAVVYSSFLQRGYDQIIHDIALQHLPVHIIIDRASLAPADGVTHHGIYDVAMLLQTPGIRILCPATFGGLYQMLFDTKESDTPVAIRYANKGEDPHLLETFYPLGDTEDYAPRYFGSDDPKVVLVSYGVAAQNALAATERLIEEGEDAGMVLLQEVSTPKGVAEQLSAHIPQGAALVFLEEGIYHGGAAMAITAALSILRRDITTRTLAIYDPTREPTTPMDLRAFHGISQKDAYLTAKELLS